MQSSTCSSYLHLLVSFRAEQPGDARPDVDVTTPEGLLLTLISQYPGAAKPAVILMMLEAQAANVKVCVRNTTRLEPSSAFGKHPILFLLGDSNLEGATRDLLHG